MQNPYLQALLNPINLAMLGLAAAAGLCAAWWLFPLGLVFWAVMFFRVARDPVVQIDHGVQSRTPLAPRFQTRFDRIERLQIRLFRNLSSADSASRKSLQPIQDKVNALTEQAYRLCLRVSALENYRLISELKDNVALEKVNLTDKLAKTTDPHLKQEYTQALESLDQRVLKRKQVNTFLDRLEEQLNGLSNTLEEVLAETLRLQAMGKNELKKNHAPLLARLEQESADLARFEGESAMQSEADFAAEA